MKKSSEVKILDKPLAEHVAIFFIAWYMPVAMGHFFVKLKSDFIQFLIALAVYIFLEVFIHKIIPYLKSK